MKRFLTLIVVTCAFIAASAKYPMVTLSHNGELSFFTDLTAIEDAIDMAQTGDTIYLSEGDFMARKATLNLKKRLSIIGMGYSSRIIANVNVNIEEKADHIKAPLFDGVKLGSLSFNNSSTSREYLNESEIRNCWISDLSYANFAGFKVMINKCYIENGGFGNSTVSSVIVKNCKIGKVTSNPELILNCNVRELTSFPNSVLSSILYKVDNNYAPYIVNSLITKKTNNNSFVSECYLYEGEDPLLDDNLDCTVDLLSNAYLGIDGTVVGVYGGEYPFSENPSVPTVDTSKSSVDYDEENDKLKVSITVVAD